MTFDCAVVVEQKLRPQRRRLKKRMKKKEQNLKLSCWSLMLTRIKKRRGMSMMKKMLMMMLHPW